MQRSRSLDLELLECVGPTASGYIDAVAADDAAVVERVFVRAAQGDITHLAAVKQREAGDPP